MKGLHLNLHVRDVLHLCLGLQHGESLDTTLVVHAGDPHATARAELGASGSGPPKREQHRNPTEPPPQQAHLRVLAARFKTPGCAKAVQKRALASGASERETRRNDLERVGDLVSRVSFRKVSLLFWPLFAFTQNDGYEMR